MNIDNFVRDFHARYLHSRAELLRSLAASKGNLTHEHHNALLGTDAEHAALLRSYGFTVNGDGGPIQMKEYVK